jgi:hypothetical protein
MLSTYEKKSIKAYSFLTIICFVIYLCLDVFSIYFLKSSNINSTLYIVLRLLALTVTTVFFFQTFSSLPQSEANPNKRRVSQNRTIIESLFYTNDSLLILRFFAAFCVFFTHMRILLHSDSISSNWFLDGCAHSGMVIFFTLSGYLMGKAFILKRYECSQSGIVSFYQNRFTRIAPLAFSIFLLFSNSKFKMVTSNT